MKSLLLAFALTLFAQQVFASLEEIQPISSAIIQTKLPADGRIGTNCRVHLLSIAEGKSVLQLLTPQGTYFYGWSDQAPLTIEAQADAEGIVTNRPIVNYQALVGYDVNNRLYTHGYIYLGKQIQAADVGGASYLEISLYYRHNVDGFHDLVDAAEIRTKDVNAFGSSKFRINAICGNKLLGM